MKRHGVPRSLLLCGLVALLALVNACSSSEHTTAGVDADAADVGLSLDVAVTPDIPVIVDVPGKLDIGQAPEIAQLPSCESDEDCDSQEFCLPSYEGKACLRECFRQADCPFGYFCKATLVDSGMVYFACLPDLPQLCLPCASDARCEAGACVEIDGESRCATYCDATENASCPDGYACADVGDVDPADPDLGLCKPVTGSCECSERTSGQKRACVVEGGEGACQGFETCDPERGWVDCDAPLPTAEDCDGIDNDCDGAIDEGLPETQPCELSVDGVGTCEGEAICAGQFGWLCDAPTPSVEACDYLDNDCDGETDEDFRSGGLYAVQEHCGACNVSCDGAILNGSAFCDTSLGDPVCAVLACDDGFYAVGRFRCLPNDVELCRPCSSDVQCSGGVCLAVGGAGYCSAPCAVEQDCPDDFFCLAYADAAGRELGSFCLPANGTCDCTAETAGDERACTIANEHGTCFGTEHCEVNEGWVGCTASVPEAELCDGVDNDCDGTPDDGLPLEQPCEVEVPGVGSCPGLSVCFGASGWVCDAPAPSEEICDAWDNDCDGETDEGFRVDGAYLLPEHCGRCGVSCAEQIPNATAACELGPDDAPRCVVSACAPGFYAVSETQCLRVATVLCSPCLDDGDCYGGHCVVSEDGLRFCSRPCDEGGVCPDGYSCTDSGAPLGELCLPVSGDCQCTRGEAGLSRACFVSNEAGTCAGVEICDPDTGWSDCSAPQPAAEDCNGVDDDCDGLVDELEAAPAACESSNAYGSCEGIRVCAGGSWSCTAGTPAEELCNYLDDDCDGVVDDPFVQDGRYLDDENCGGCGNSCVDAVPNGSASCGLFGDAATCLVTACDEGFVQLNAFSCVARPAILCLPCEGDDDCLGGSCYDDGDSAFCTIACDVGGCPTGYGCTDIGAGVERCLPESGSCDCDPTMDGRQRLCERANEIGVCSGVETCDAVSGWGDCDAPEPAVESCNGQDDDCDGRVDEDFGGAEPCEQSNEYGTCAGVARCLGPAGLVCDAAEPAVEACNLRDDDCDGETDEDFLTDGLYLDDEHCGTCGHSCAGAIEHATSACGVGPTGAPACVVSACDEGFVAINDFACVLPPNTSCRPCDSDEDCYGATCTPLDGGLFCLAPCALDADCAAGTQCLALAGADDRLCLPLSGSCSCTESEDGSARVCSFVNEHGTCYGLETCDAASGWSDCDAALPAAELCNGVDDDCDGGVDEGLPETVSCTTDNAFGSCAGQAVCVGALGWVCDAPAAGSELCDGVDNDCDGETDEAGALGCVIRYADLDEDGHGAWDDALCLCGDSLTYTAAAGGDCDDADANVSPSAAELCNGVDDDCDGTTDEEGAAGCAPYYADGDGDGYGVPGPSRCLCGPSEAFPAALLGDCDDTDGGRSPGEPETCDGVDQDCDGLTDEEGAADCTPYYRDGDEDGYGRDDDVRCLCAPAPPYTLESGGDCNDTLPAVHPDAAERCNSFDDDCDGATDEDAVDCLTFYRDDDEDGFGVTGDSACRCLPDGPYEAVAPGDCDDGEADVNPVATEVCNGIDDDCDGSTDPGFDLPLCSPYYADGDGDDYGLDSDVVCACGPDEGHPVDVGGDCDDANVDIHPEARDDCNGVDDDCDGETDEGTGDFDGDGIADCVDPCPIIVDVTAADGGDGSVAAPFPTIQAGIDGAGSCAEVWVLPGTYVENLVFGGHDVLVRSTEGADATTIDGDGTGSAVRFADGEGASAGLVGFTITGGTGSPGSAPWGDPALTYGGGVFVQGASPQITDCLVEGNSVTGRGGGLFLYDSEGVVTGGAIRDNTASSTGEAGAGVALQSSAAQVLGASIRGNSTPGFGGGVLLLSSGGSLRYAHVTGNTATEGAGVRISEYGTAVVDSNVIADNEGEGVSFHHYSSTRFIGNTVVGNAGHGLRLTLCCGALYAVPLIKNVIVAYNDDDGIHTDTNVDFGLFFTDVYGNDGGNYGGVMGSLRNSSLGITDHNCLFVQYSDDDDPDNDDFRLGSGSPCIDSGGDVTLYFSTRDFAGNPRPMDGSGNGVAQYDRGAFEAQ